MDRITAISIGNDATIRQGMQAIDRGACWIALVVGSDGKLLGLLTDGDVRRATSAPPAKPKLCDSVIWTAGLLLPEVKPWGIRRCQ